MTPDPRRTLGQAGEELAAQHLVRRGFTILERNFRTRWGELDIVAYNRGTLVFCEVKTRRARPAGMIPAVAAVGRQKQAQVRKMASSWLITRSDHPRAPEIRFDAIGITLGKKGAILELEHLEGAF